MRKSEKLRLRFLVSVLIASGVTVVGFGYSMAAVYGNQAGIHDYGTISAFTISSSDNHVETTPDGKVIGMVAEKNIGESPVLTPGNNDNSIRGVYDAESPHSNSVLINSPEYVFGNVEGAIANSGDAKGNTVSIINGRFYNSPFITGARNIKGSADGNAVSIAEGSFTGASIFGASSEGDGKNNNVSITGGTFSGTDITGALAGNNPPDSKGTALENKVHISGSNFSGNRNSVVAGLARGGDASSNIVIIEKGKYTFDTIYGGEAHGNIGSTPVHSDNNEVTIEEADVGDVRGGYSSLNGNADKNIVRILGGTYGGESGSTNYLVVGGMTEHGSASQNRVEITKGTIHAWVLGGQTMEGDASKNEVIISDASGSNLPVQDGTLLGNQVVGGYSVTGGSANENIVTINGGFFSDDIKGGIALKEALHNTVTIKDGHFSYLDVTAGEGGEVSAENKLDIDSGFFSGSDEKRKLRSGYGGGEVSGNEITVRGGTFENIAIYAGESTNGIVSGNQITITGGDFSEIHNSALSIAGGYSESTNKNVFNNSVTISGGTFGENVEVAGGYSYDGKVIQNKVTISGGTFSDSVLGGYSWLGPSYGNTVNISGSPKKTIFTGYIIGGRSEVSDASNNTVTILDGKYGHIIYGGIASTKNALDNKVEIKGGEFSSSLYGGVAGGENSGSQEVHAAKNNKLIISGGTFMGGWQAGGAASLKAAAQGNETVISGGSFTDNLIIGGFSHAGEVSGNSIAISAGTFDKTKIYGGYNDYDGIGSVTANTVSIYGGSFKDTWIYGGVSNGNLGGNVINLLAEDGHDIFKNTGQGIQLNNAKTLNVYGTNYVVESVRNIENYNFYIPAKAVNGDTMLTITNATGGAEGFVPTTGEEVTIRAGVMGGSDLKKGDKINLIDANFKIPDTGINYGTLTEGVSVDYVLAVQKDGKKVVATIGDVTSGGSTDPSDPGQQPDPSNPGQQPDPGKPGEQPGQSESSGSKSGLKHQTKSLVETRAATISMLNYGSDLLAGSGFDQALAVANGREMTPFMAVGGGKIRANSGSHVDTKGYAADLGFAKKVENGAGSLVFGPVVEYGRGSYDSYMEDIHGSGDSHYWGVGFMARQTNHSGFYYEGSVRVGKSKADYHTGDMNGGTTHVSYDTRSTYVSAHAGLGKKMDISDENTLDVYGKYFYSHQAGDDVHLSTGETYHFDSVDSNRIRIGARLSHDFGKANNVYGGLAYQYEFSGSARAHYKGYDTPSPSVKGASGLAEVGVILQRDEHSPWSVDLGVNGYTGKMKGVTFGVKLGYSF